MKRIVVLGGGESGYGTAILARVLGLDVWLSDAGQIAEKYIAELDRWGVPYEQGGHSQDKILQADEVIKSPGIPDSAPIVQKIRQTGIPVVSEIEFAGHYTSARTVCITGSNGKTTTTTLVYEIMRHAGLRVALGGNIGESFAYNVAMQIVGGYSPIDWYVLELSSFQLDGMFDFRADIAILMNITPDHLDRYEYQMQNYVNSKMRIVQNQTSADSFIYCADDEVICGELAGRSLASRLLPFTAKGDSRQAARIDLRSIRAAAGGQEMVLALDKMQIKGIHNAYNAMAASLAAMVAGVSALQVEKTLTSFGGVEHRLEFVCERGGVVYINDSKATNVDSVWYALESMTRPVVWIAGGTDKGNDYAPLIEFARTKVKALICMGVDNSKLLTSFEGVVPQIFDTRSIEEAMGIAREVAVSGDVVLLSPACASFDLFKNYEDRGRQFKVAAIK